MVSGDLASHVTSQEDLRQLAKYPGRHSRLPFLPSTADTTVKGKPQRWVTVTSSPISFFKATSTTALLSRTCPAQGHV